MYCRNQRATGRNTRAARNTSRIAELDTGRHVLNRSPELSLQVISLQVKDHEPILREGKKGGIGMLWTICVILLVLWLLGLVSGYTMGGFVHILLVIAIIVIVVRLIQGRRVV